MRPRTRSPVKDKPLRNRGQSLREQHFDLVFDRALGPDSGRRGVVALFAVTAGRRTWRV